MFVYLNLIGDGIHNFVDGMIIAASFMLSYDLGFATTLAVVSHEIP
jgi:zinc and cadmium transporter